MQVQERKRQISARKLSILLLLAAPNGRGVDRAGIHGTTRMQKLVFLAQERSREFLKDDETFRFDFAFSADRFGPADLELYQDLELLKLSGWIRTDGESGMPEPGQGRAAPETLDSLLGDFSAGPRLLPEESEETELSFDYLMGERSEEIELAEAEQEREHEYSITEKGMAGLEQIRGTSSKPEKFDRLAKVCLEIKREYSGWPLTALLRFVYTAYPATTTKSEIKDRVLRL